MQFPNSYFENEVRDGFYVPSMMKRVWAVQLEILEEIDRICKKNNITYFADWGTLLGAVRHGGFIPWDDDMDICMKREDYNRFVAVAQRELPKGYLVLNKQINPDYGELFTRVVNSRQINFEKSFLEKFHGCPYVVGIDIFPLDYISRNSEEEKARCELIRLVQSLMDALESCDYDEEWRKRCLKRIEEMCHVTINREEPLQIQLYRILEGLYSLYTDAEAEELTVMPLWLKGVSFKISKSYYESTIKIPFENTDISVPTHYDAVLKQKYKDYMKLIKGGGAHDYPFYHGQETILEKKIGKNPYRYIFSQQDMLSATVVKRKSKRSLMREQLLQLEEISANVYTDKSVLESLEKCQNTAIQLGTLIEEVQGEGTESVHLLEEYCESVYRIYEQLSQGCSVEDTFADGQSLSLRELAARVKDCVEKEVDVRHKVLFLSYKAEYWESLESVWREAGQDPMCDVYVMPIPYFYKNPDGSLGEMCYEADQYPKYVPITKYNEYDFENSIPEMIYIQNPYDEYDSCITVHPFFYASNLKKYTEKLIYIPEIVVDEFESTNKCAMINMRHYCVTPGVIFADKVCVQSERMRDLYIQILTETAGEDTRPIWEEKILGIGSPKEDGRNALLEHEKKIPEEWRAFICREDGSCKKVILYYTSISGFMQHKDQMIAKIRDVFQVFLKNREDVVMLWKPHSLIKTTLEQTDAKLYQEYCSLEKEYLDGGIGILDESLDDKRAVAVCDAYYGDTSPLVQRFRNEGKPVLLQSQYEEVTQ